MTHLSTTATTIVVIMTMIILPLQVSAATLNAGIADATWRNTTSATGSCSFEHVAASVEEPAATGRHRKIRTYKSADVPHEMTASEHANMPTITRIDSLPVSSVITTSTPTCPSTTYQPSTEFADLVPYMNNITNGIEGLIRAQSEHLLTNNSNNSNNNNNDLASKQTLNATNTTNKPSPSTHENEAAATLAVISHTQYKLVFLNTTAPSYVLLDHHNAKVIVWTIPAKASSATTHKTWILRVADHLMAWLPLLELLGMAAFFWKIGWWIRLRWTGRGQGRQATGEPRV